MRLAAEDAAAVMVLIESLDDDGYLGRPARGDRRAPGDEDDEAREENWSTGCAAACASCRAWTPPAWARANLGECLTLQLRAAAATPGASRQHHRRRATSDLLARRDPRS